MLKTSLSEHTDKCRNCNHFEYQHNGHGSRIPCLEILDTIYNKKEKTIYVTNRCGCINYKPLDNLKYLEELYEQKFKS